MKKAFTLTELIFVMIVIGILVGVGFSSLNPNYLSRDSEFVLIKIKQARYNAIGNDNHEETNNCIQITKKDINDKEISDKSQTPYKLHVDIQIISPNSFNSDNKLCFDSLGRPYNGDSYTSTGNLKLDKLIKNFLDIKLTYNSKNCTIRVYPYGGYGIILCES